MRSWFGFLVSIPLFLLANSEKVTDCGPTECHQLRDRLNILESAVRSIVSAIASQKKGPLAAVNKIIERDSTLRDFLQPSTGSSTSHFVSTNSTVQFGSEENARQEKNPTNLQLKEVFKCSLSHLLDINTAETGINSPSGKINVLLGVNNSLEIEWTPRSSECLKFSSGVWISVFESYQPQPPLGNEYLAIPQKCLQRRSNASFYIVLPNSSVEASRKNICHFELKNALLECRTYTVEVIPNYQSLKGRPMLAKIVIPPNKDNTTIMESLISIGSDSNSLTLRWEDNSGCAPQLTAFNLIIYPEEGGTVVDDSTVSNFKIPRSCITQPTKRENEFFLAMSTNHTCNSVIWRPLDDCRKYKLEVRSEYSGNWMGASSVWETFTVNQRITPLSTMWADCLNEKKTFSCGSKTCIHSSWVCDRDNDCQSQIDELYCSADCQYGFRCGRQCFPKEHVCNGVQDCFDGSDEVNCHYDSSPICDQLTADNGKISSLAKSKFLNPIQKFILISVPTDKNVWLAFVKFSISENRYFKVYDGPYSTSPLLLSHTGSSNPASIRSSRNNLYLEFPSYNDTNNGVEIFYTSILDNGQPFIPGCGGYLYGDGVVSWPAYGASDDDDVFAECNLYVEAKQSGYALLLKKMFTSAPPQVETIFENGLIVTTHHVHGPKITVYDGWSRSGQVLYDERVPPHSSQTKNVFYSISHKIMIQFLPPLFAQNTAIFYWNVSTMWPTFQCNQSLVEASGTIKSPNFPAAYPNFSDCRWNVVTAPGSKIQLFFPSFETQEGFDFVFVYDGPTMSSPLLLEKSGSSSALFTLNSTTKQLLVRFTSDEASTFPGFLVVYSTI